MNKAEFKLGVAAFTPSTMTLLAVAVPVVEFGRPLKLAVPPASTRNTEVLLLTPTLIAVALRVTAPVPASVLERSILIVPAVARAELTITVMPVVVVPLMRTISPPAGTPGPGCAQFVLMNQSLFAPDTQVTLAASASVAPMTPVNAEPINSDR